MSVSEWKSEKLEEKFEINLLCHFKWTKEKRNEPKKNQFIEKISFDHNVDAQWMKKKQKLQLELEVDKKKSKT